MLNISISEDDLLCRFEFSEIPLVSTNDMYFSRPKKSKKNPNFITTYTIRTPELKKFQSIMEEKLPSLIDRTIFDKYDLSKYGLLLSIVIYLPKDRYLLEDSSNYIKAYEDTISKYIGIDDKYNLTVIVHKSISDDSNWRVETEIYKELMEA